MKGNKKELIIGAVIIGVIVLTAITVALILLTTGKPADEKIKSLTLDQTNISEEIIVGGERVAALTAFTKNITEELVWSSSNEQVAVVEADGETAVITLKAEGTATITVKAGELSAQCQVSVKEVESRIVIAPNMVEEGIVKGSTKVITLTAALENLEGDITWSVDNSEVATIVGNGESAELTLKGVGNAVVTAKVGDKTATCNVKVNDVTSMITLKTTNIKREIKRGDTYSQTLEVTLLNVKGELQWTSSNTKVAKVEKTSDTKAKVTLVGEGKAVVTVTDGNVKATCSVNVTHPPVSIALNKTSVTKTITLGVAQTFKDELKATLKNATGTINWKSSNTSVATVDKTGTTVSINALKAGSTTITATCKVGAKTYSATCVVTVKEIIPKITLKTTKNQKVGFGDTATIEVNVDPSDVKLNWNIDKPSNVTIEEQTNTKLKLKSTSAGMATVVVSYGSQSVTSTVEWKKPELKSITGANNVHYLDINTTASLNLKANVDFLGNQKVNWSYKIEGMNSTGLLTANNTSASLLLNKAGTYIVTASVPGGNTIEKRIKVYTRKLEVLHFDASRYIGQAGEIGILAEGYPIDSSYGWEIISGKNYIQKISQTSEPTGSGNNDSGSARFYFNYKVIGSGVAKVKFYIRRNGKNIYYKLL